MATKQTLMRSFNNHFIEMMADILLIFPNNADIKSGLNSFEMIKQLNPSLVIKMWHSKVSIPYSDIINKGDISFFCEKDYSEDLETVANANDIMFIIERIRGPIRSMVSNDKQQTIKYIQNLNQIANMYSTC
jgi:hypothetical protein